jgi:NAD+ synthase
VRPFLRLLSDQVEPTEVKFHLDLIPKVECLMRANTLRFADMEETLAVIEWIRFLVEKTGAKGLMLGFSGGIDSAVAALLCIAAIGVERVKLVNIAIKSSHSSESDARRLAKWMGTDLLLCPLEATFGVFMHETKLNRKTEVYNDLSDEDRGKLKGNVKARLRTTLIRAWAEAHGYLMVNTCNWSETVVGYDTKGGGDADGDISPLHQFIKDDVRLMLGFVSEILELETPQWLLDKAPSADLEEGQTDEDDLEMTYENELDLFARVFAAGGMSAVMSMKDDGMEDFDAKRERFVYLKTSTNHKRASRPVYERDGFHHMN